VPEHFQVMVKNPSAFTLVELLVVIAIIAGLAVAVFAGASQIIEKSKSTKSLSNLRQLGMAALTYAAENNGQLPQSTHQGPSLAWTKTLKNYVPAALFISPLDDTGRFLSYAINDFITMNPFGAEAMDYSRLQNQPSPSRTLFMGILNSSSQNSDHFHFAEDGFSPADFEQEVWVEIIDHSSHYLFVDGHVEVLRWDSVKTLLTQPGSAFIRPDGKTN
jgi:prepilin-type N-terminal cleavage/methylation domain-containing protein/prepilin-type processing-associated H-X9-DG protein